MIPAKTCYDRAIHAARQADDRRIEAYATLRQGYLDLYGRKTPVAGLERAQRVAVVSAGDAPALSGLALLLVAEANAMLGNAPACERALSVARSQLDVMEHRETSESFFSVAEYDRIAGSCYLSLNRLRLAEGSLCRAAHALTSKAKSQAIVLGNLGLSRIRRLEFEGAAEALTKAIDTLEGTRGGGGLNVAFTAGRELRPWRGMPVVDDVIDRLFGLAAN